MAYDTNNPLGSKDPRDLYDNATNFDNYANGPDPMYPNRFGDLKLSIEGMNQQFISAQEGREDAFDGAQSNRATVFQNFMDQANYTFNGDYAAGLEFTSRAQYFVRNGVMYVPENDLTLPYTTTGVWATEQTLFKVLAEDAVLRQELLASDGATLVGQGTRTVGANLDDTVNVLNYGPVDTPSNTLATWTAALAAADAAGKALLVPSGTYTFVDIPNFAKSNRHMYAEGRVILQSTGTSWAMDMTAGVSNMYNFRMIGDWVIEGNASNTGGIHIQALHHSDINLRVMNVPGRAFQINYAVLTKFKLTASINVGPGSEWTIIPTTGLYIDKRGTGEFCSASWFDMRIEGINGVGVDIIECQQSSFTGTSEHQASIGIRTGAGSRYNTFNNVDIEQNLANDLWLGGRSDIWNNTTCRSAAVTNNIEIVSGAINNQFYGGDLRCAMMNSGSSGTNFVGCMFSDNGSLGMKGTGGYTHSDCARYDVTGVLTYRYSTKFGTSGTFVPTLEGLTTPGSHTYSQRYGFFTDTGSHIEGEIFLALSAKDAAMSGAVLISGLPYQSDSTANRYVGGAIGLHGGVTLPAANYSGLGWRITPGGSAISLFANGFGVALAQLLSTTITSTTAITITFRYPKLPQA